MSTVTRLVEPTHQGEGAEIRKRAAQGPPMTAQEELDLFVTDRRRNVRDNVLPALEAGTTLAQCAAGLWAFRNHTPEVELSVTAGKGELLVDENAARLAGERLGYRRRRASFWPSRRIVSLR